MGNYPAESVVVYDTLSHSLDIKTLNKIKTSHDAIFTVIEEHILKWEFPFINLPDVEHNEPESHGYVQFEIYPVSHLTVDTTIENSATIIFDYYQTTVTNITNILVNPYIGNNLFIVYPQPVKDNLVAQYNSSLDETIQIEFYNIMGQLLTIEDYNVSVGWNRFDYDVSNFTSGLYFIVIKSAKQTMSKKIIKR